MGSGDPRAIIKLHFSLQNRLNSLKIPLTTGRFCYTSIGVFAGISGKHSFFPPAPKAPKNFRGQISPKSVSGSVLTSQRARENVRNSEKSKKALVSETRWGEKGAQMPLVRSRLFVFDCKSRLELVKSARKTKTISKTEVADFYYPDCVEKLLTLNFRKHQPLHIFCGEAERGSAA